MDKHTEIERLTYLLSWRALQLTNPTVSKLVQPYSVRWLRRGSDRYVLEAASSDKLNSAQLVCAIVPSVDTAIRSLSESERSKSIPPRFSVQCNIIRISDRVLPPSKYRPPDRSGLPPIHACAQHIEESCLEESRPTSRPGAQVLEKTIDNTDSNAQLKGLLGAKLLEALKEHFNEQNLTKQRSLQHSLQRSALQRSVPQQLAYKAGGLMSTWCLRISTKLSMRLSILQASTGNLFRRWSFALKRWHFKLQVRMLDAKRKTWEWRGQRISQRMSQRTSRKSPNRPESKVRRLPANPDELIKGKRLE